MSAPPPRVSVYVPTRNRPRLVEAAVHSVLAQTCREIEVLVVDDASDDDTPAVLARLAATDPRVRTFRQPAPRGAAAARNVAIAAARGEFVTGLDDDDLMLPDRVARFLAAWRDEYAFLCSAYLLEGRGWRRPVAAVSETIPLDRLLHGNCVGNQVYTRTARIRALGGFDEAFAASQDYDLWTRLVERHGPALRLPEPTMIVRAGTADRISASPAAATGARQYVAKHAARMRPEHLRSQRLVEIAARRGRLRLRDLRACWTPGNAGSVIRYWAVSNLPGVRSAGEWVWRLRWPAAAPLPFEAD